MSKRLVYAEDVKENILGALDIMREVSENSTLVDTISNAVCSCIDLTDTAESEKRGKWVNCGGVTSVPWNSPGQNAGVGSLSLSQGIFPTQRLNPGFPHCRRILTS